MRVSTKGRYGLRVLLDIAVHQGEGVVALRDIAQRQAISQKYLWQVINPLKSAGILRATRGARGGYALARRPDEISVQDVVSILEGDTSVVACVGKPDTCERSADCTTREAWAEIEGKFNDAMRGITLGTLMERELARDKVAGASYVI
jgi:Rrf2 family protein